MSSNGRDIDRIFKAVIAVALAAVLISVTAATLHRIKDGKSAFLRWQPQVKELASGEDVYAKYTYPNTPVVALMLYPLASLPPTVGAIAFFCLKVGMATAAAIWAIRLAVGGRHGMPAWAVGLILLLSARPILSDLQHGNINIIILFLVMLGLWMISGGRRFPGGLFIGAAVVIKVTPGLFLLYFIYKRQWVVLLGCVTGMLIAVLLPILVLGPRTNYEFHHKWFDQMITPYLTDARTTYTAQINQSLPGMVFRLTTESPGVDLPQGEDVRVNVLSLDPEAAKQIVRIGVLLILAWLVFVCRTRSADPRDWRFTCEYGLILIAMLMLSERSWKHHYVTMALPFAALVAYMALESPPRAMRRYVGGTLLAAFVLMVCTSGDLIGWIYKGVAHKYAEAFGTFFFAGLAVFAAISAILLRERYKEPEGRFDSGPRGEAGGSGSGQGDAVDATGIGERR
ncbi:MAG: glycosyltransferase family 87 protein [Planctomycetota bacterium]